MWAQPTTLKGRPPRAEGDRAAWGSRRAPASRGGRGYGGLLQVELPLPLPLLSLASLPAMGAVREHLSLSRAPLAPWSPGFLALRSLLRAQLVLTQPVSLSSLKPEYRRHVRIMPRTGEDGAAEEKHHVTLKPYPVGSCPHPGCACGDISVWPNHKAPIWRIPFSNHLGPTSITTLPHKKPRGISSRNHQRQGSKTKFRH